MKILLIDPRKKVVEEVEYDDQIETMYKLLGHKCFEFQAIVLNIKRDILYIDANARTALGMQNYNPRLDLWQHKRYSGPLTGRGLVIGTDADGNSIEPSCLIEHLTHEIRWRQT